MHEHSELDWDAPFVLIDDARIKFHFASMQRAHVAACERWLIQMEAAINDGKRKPVPNLLLKGLPRGSLRESRVVKLNGQNYIAFQVADRTERLVDLSTFCCMRLMALPGGDCEWWFDRATKKNLPKEQQRFYPRFTRRMGIWGFRIFADAKPGEVIRQRSLKSSNDHWGFRDLRMINFFRTTRKSEQRRGKRMRSTYRGRAIAIDACLGYFSSNPLNLPHTIEAYRALLIRAFALHDRLHQIEDRTVK